MMIVGGGDSAASDRRDVLLPSEVKAYVEAMTPSTFDELGSLGWIEKHRRVEQLTIQAIVEALANREEMVKDNLLTHEKLIVLIHDVVLVELWREEILPLLLQSTPLTNSFTPYMILFHEATCVTLLETALFHPDAAQTLDHDALDLIDYAQRAISKLLDSELAEHEAETEKDDPDAEIRRQTTALALRIGFKCITILRYVIENIDKINSAVVPRLIVSGDAPMLLTDLILKKPWRRINLKGQEQEYSDERSTWVDVKPTERLALGKIEVQAWLAIYQVFLCPRVISTYEIHHHRRSQLLRLTGLLNEVVLDQLPILGEFQRWLHELSLSAHFGPSDSPLIIEMLPQHRTALEQDLSRRKGEILKLNRDEILGSSRESLAEKAKKLAAVYDVDALESVLPTNQCANARCGRPALKKCSRCHFQHYCCRECQVADWPKHKPTCDKLCSNNAS